MTKLGHVDIYGQVCSERTFVRIEEAAAGRVMRWSSLAGTVVPAGRLACGAGLSMDT